MKTPAVNMKILFASFSFLRCSGFAISLFLCALLGSCAWLYPVIQTSGGISRAGQYSAQVVECVGNAGNQSITLVLMITNTGPNTQQFICGNSGGTMAVDVYGNTLKPYSNTGINTELPSGVPVRVTIARLEPIPPGTPMLRTVRVSIGTRNNMLEFRNVPIVW